MARPYVLPVPVQAPLGLDRLDTTYITGNQLMVLIASVALLIVAWFLINRTRLGLAWRATEQDFETASAFGVNIDRAVASNFFLGSAVAGAAGVLVDEGSTGLMPIFVDKVFVALSELNRRRVSILLVE